MVLSKLYSAGRPSIWIIVGQGPTALAVGAGGDVCTFNSSSFNFSLSPSFLETARLKYCLKGPLKPKQPTNCTALPGLALSARIRNRTTPGTQCETLRRSHLRCLNSRTENRRPIYRMAPAANTK